MSGTTLRIIISIFLLGHGVGHVMGIIPALQLVDSEKLQQGALKNWSSDSWLLTRPLGDRASRTICAALYGAAAVGFIAAALGVWGWLVPEAWWRTLAVISVIPSLLALLLYWNALMLFFPHKVGALAVNLVTLVAVLWAHWPTAAELAAASGR